MFVIIGLVLVLGAVVAGYAMHGGNFGVLIQPSELVILFGAALGSFLAANGLSNFTKAIKSVLGLLKPDPYTPVTYLDLLKMMYTLFNVARKEGLLGLEQHIETPDESEIIRNYPTFLSNHHAVCFFCDTMKVIGKIRELDGHTINQIAAGEVVERPSSVVKELLENAIDAGATQVTIEIRKAGRELIRIADNGCGMSHDDALLSLLRHATSKIRTAEDLLQVSTLGFRGEALASIASVSKLTMRTAEEDGIRIGIRSENGQVERLDPVGGTRGTEILVENLFYNTPARLKFLKSDATELGACIDIAGRLAVAHPQVSIRVVQGKLEVFSTPGQGDPYETLAHVWGRELVRSLAEIDAEVAGIRLRGFVSPPYVTKSSRSYQFFFVNGRSVKSRSLTVALDQAYRDLTPERRFAVVALSLSIDPSRIDINVSPTKSDVRFQHEGAAFEALKVAIRGGLMEHGMIPSAEAIATANSALALLQSASTSRFSGFASVQGASSGSSNSTSSGSTAYSVPSGEQASFSENAAMQNGVGNRGSSTFASNPTATGASEDQSVEKTYFVPLQHESRHGFGAKNWDRTQSNSFMNVDGGLEPHLFIHEQGGSESLQLEEALAVFGAPVEEQSGQVPFALDSLLSSLNHNGNDLLDRQLRTSEQFLERIPEPAHGHLPPSLTETMPNSSLAPHEAWPSEILIRESKSNESAASEGVAIEGVMTNSGASKCGDEDSFDVSHAQRTVSQRQPFRELLDDLRIIGQVQRTFIIAETRHGLAIIDQHVAHERVLYEWICGLKGYDSVHKRGGVERQTLLTPLTLHLDPRAAIMVREQLSEVERSGFELEPFGGESFLVRAVPSVLKNKDPLKILTKIVEELAEGTVHRRIPPTCEQVWAMAACKMAVKAGDLLSIAEMQKLIEDLALTENPYLCPHGRPITVTLDGHAILKLFKRA